MRWLVGFVLTFCFAAAACRPEEPTSPPELGRVQWLRDIGKGQELARSSKKPLLVLFQEVPG